MKIECFKKFAAFFLIFPAILFAEAGKPAIYAKSNYDKESNTLSFDYCGRQIISVSVPKGVKLDFRRLSDGCMLTSPLTQQIFVGVYDTNSVKAKITFRMSDRAICMKPRRASDGEAILGQVGLPLIYGVNGLYDIEDDYLLSWSNFSWRWTGRKFCPDEGGGLKAEAEVTLSEIPWIICFQPRFYCEHLNWKYHKSSDYMIKTSPISGWCSWQAYGNRICETVITNMASFLARNFLPYGLDYLQIDDGYQDNDVGLLAHQSLADSWLKPNAKFPHGIKAVAELVKSYGLKPGIWSSMDIRSFDYGYYGKNFLLRDRSGEEVKAPWLKHAIDGESNTVETLFVPHWRSLVEAGYSYLKVDLLRHVYYDGFGNAVRSGSMNDSEARKRFRNIFSKIRKSIGNECFFLPCWGVFSEGVGYADAMRLATDANSYWERQHQQQYDMARYWPLQRILFQLDPDHVCAASSAVSTRSTLSTVSLSGCLLMLSDAIQDYDDERIHAIQRCIPPLETLPAETGSIDFHSPSSANINWSYYTNANCICENNSGLYFKEKGDSPFGSLWAIHFERPYGTWCVAHRTALWNLPDCQVPLDKLGLDPKDRYLVFDFWRKDYWNGVFLGSVTDNINFEKLQIGDCQTLIVRKDTGLPQFIGSSRHISGGANELTSQEFKNDCLSLTVNRQPEDYVIFVYVPDGYSLKSFTAYEGLIRNTKLNSDRVIRFWISSKFDCHNNIEIHFSHEE